MSTALIFGAGSGVGKALATKFATNGFKVALGSRSGYSGDPQNPIPNAIAVKVDVTKPEEVQAAFHKTESTFGSPVNVVVFNVGILTPSPSPKDPFSLPYDRFLSDVTSGGLAAYSVLQRAVESFKRIEECQPKVFIATSNTLGVTRPVASLTALGSQKKQLAYFVESGHQTYNDFRFYLATQVNSRGGSPGKELSSEAHAITYWNLIQRKEKGGWDIRFLKDGSILVEN